ncbi:CHAT domain-containing protein [Microcoleus sp. FACHB-68]|nr:CHAT domain-containing protein [Microcoleus sp. FACHB-68]
MDEQRIQAYLSLIQELLSCPSEEENQILNQHAELIDEGLVQVCQRVAQQLQGEGRENEAEFLLNLGQQVAESLNSQASGGKGAPSETQPNATPEDYLRFLMAVLQAVAESENDPQVVYPILEQHQDKLDLTFAKIVQLWFKSELDPNNSEQNQFLAAILNILAVDISDFPLGNRANNLEIAIACYQVALQVYTRQAFPQDWAGTQNNLGNAYLERIQGEQAENLELAIACYQAALQVHTRQAFPQDWAMTQNNLGNAYLERIQGERAENLEIAIACYQAALQVHTRQASPQDWAGTQNNLGNAYRERIQGERAENLELAIACYQAALQVRTRQAFPKDHTETLNNLGFTYQDQSIHYIYISHSAQKQTALENAYRTFAQAIDSVEHLRGEITSGDEAKRKLNEEWNKLYRGMVKVCLELGNNSAAIEYADRSKARNLVELIATRAAYPEGISLQVRQRLQQLPLEIEEENRRLAQDPNPDYTQITQLRQEVQEKSPYKPLEFQQIQSLLDQETAILEWYVLGDKFLTFILTPQTLHFWQSTPEDLNNLFDWVSEYLADYQRNKTQWQNRLSQRLEALAQILHLDDILHSLFDKFPTCKKLILIPHFFLHLFPIHALPVHLPSPSEIEGKPLQEWFPNGVSYAPSCQLLQQAQNRQRPDFNQLFAIQNPTQDLAFTDIEVEAIQSYFNPHHILKHDKAEKTALNLNNAHCTHFACHGYFNLNDPLKSALLLANSEFLPPPPDEDQTRYIPLQNGNLLDLGKCLTLEDILRLDLRNCRLVTLSACETGITDFTSISDEYIGLPSGFILAGSPNVVSSLWAVNDLSTALLMIRFYENLKNGATVPLALQHAQIWLRNATAETLQQWSSQLTLRSTHQRQFRRFSTMDSTAKPFASPYYWAGFCAIGA